jgi:hypothetical protein
VNLSDEPASTTSFQSTHAIDIFAFVEADEIPFSCFETPYYLAPAPDGERVYALLREALNRTKKIAIAHVVIQARRRLAALIPCGSLLMLNTLRKVDRIASLLDARRQQRNLKAEPLTDKELATAARLVQSMTQKWDTACNPEVRDAERRPPGMRPKSAHKSADGRAEICSATAKRDPCGIVQPAVRLENELAVNERVANERGGDDEPAKGATLAPGSGYQAQRNTRPRVRARRTYH